ncbi:LysR substrate-binding domain-containing protein [Solitalea sp. MAHUQ-68]|uniref:LysR substrate-binding domain-containing protein n=1 Tax=Solitalea agri TaxID=2953739 RepID=A0A9X2JCS1_9SPHI|nr:LysR substrate-binding domain-containing protein [Solitalea agri]MCO4292839.1 LysR substrate-binding domain-containing protein [Solitalea agri]
MTLTQLEYIVAVDTHRHFATAADSCFITQPTLSMQIQKLEEELGIKLFDRSKQPVLPTEAGKEVIAQARVVLQESARLKEIVKNKVGEIEGHLRLGIIPTLAPYLLPLFLNSFLEKYPKVKISVWEETTENIIEHLKYNRLDAGILATPLNDSSIFEYPLFYEELLLYVSQRNELMNKEFVLTDDIDIKKLWLLQESHCMRSQIMNLCHLRSQLKEDNNFEYEAGSIETLKKMVELNNGITVLPELAIYDLTEEKKSQVRHFIAPVPVREISIVTHRSYVKKRLLDALKAEILKVVPSHMLEREQLNIVPI